MLDYVNPARSRPRVLDRPRQRSVSRPLARRDLGRSGPDRRFALRTRHRQPVISSLSSSMSDNAMQRVPKVFAREVLRLIDQ